LHSSPAQQNNNTNNTKKGRGRGSGGGNPSARRNSSSSSAKLLSDIILLNSTGVGATALEQAVVRYSADSLLQHRMRYTDAPVNNTTTTSTTCVVEWTPLDCCLWKASDRLQLIQQQQAVVYNSKPLQSQ